MNIPALFEKMMILFAVLIAGFVCGKTGVMDQDSNRAVSRLVAKLTNPMLALSSVMTGQRLMTNLQVLELTLVAVGCYVFLIGTSFLIPKLLHVPRESGGLYRFMYIFSNIGFIGYPIVGALFGDGALFHVTIFVLFFNLLCWSYGAQTITGENLFHFHWGLFKIPCVAGSLLAYVIYLSGLRVPQPVSEICSMIGGLTSPLAMLIIGCSLAMYPVKTVFTNWRVYALAVIKMVLLPVIAFFVLRLFLKDELMLGVAVVTLCMPVATSTTILSYECHADSQTASAGVFLTTLLSVVSVPAMMLLLFGK